MKKQFVGQNVSVVGQSSHIFEMIKSNFQDKKVKIIKNAKILKLRVKMGGKVEILRLKSQIIRKKSWNFLDTPSLMFNVVSVGRADE